MNERVTFEEELERHGNIVFTNVGVSMMPLLRQGQDLMVIRKKPNGRCQKYDAVLFKRSNGQYILHRITKVRPEGYFIVGDNCIAGEFVREEQILGVLTEVLRNGKRIDVERDWKYKVYVHLWVDFYPIRVLILRSLQILRGIRRRILKRLPKA